MCQAPYFVLHMHYLLSILMLIPEVIYYPHGMDGKPEAQGDLLPFRGYTDSVVVR